MLFRSEKIGKIGALARFNALVYWLGAHEDVSPPAWGLALHHLSDCSQVLEPAEVALRIELLHQLDPGDLALRSPVVGERLDRLAVTLRCGGTVALEPLEEDVPVPDGPEPGRDDAEVTAMALRPLTAEAVAERSTLGKGLVRISASTAGINGLLTRALPAFKDVVTGSPVQPVGRCIAREPVVIVRAGDIFDSRKTVALRSASLASPGRKLDGDAPPL